MSGGHACDSRKRVRHRVGKATAAEFGGFLSTFGDFLVTAGVTHKWCNSEESEPNQNRPVQAWLIDLYSKMQLDAIVEA